MGFMTKDEQVRLDNTIGFIASQVPAAERPAVQKYLKDWIAKQTGGLPKAVKEYSNLLTMTDAKNPGDKAEREKRRALMILEGMKFGASDVTMNAVKTLQTAMVNANLNDLIERLRIAADETDGPGIKLQTIFLTDLQGAPQTFLQHNRLLSGGIRDADGAYFFYEYSKNQYKIEPTPPGTIPHAYKFDAVSVPAVVWANVPGARRVRPPAVSPRSSVPS